jgi:hypothetical protein
MAKAKRWFAWYPVTTVNNKRIWLKYVGRITLPTGERFYYEWLS